jgi:tryptophan synthase alpha subunit
LADAVVVGSAIVNAFNHQPHTPQGRATAAGFVAEMVRATKDA